MKPSLVALGVLLASAVLTNTAVGQGRPQATVGIAAVSLRTEGTGSLLFPAAEGHLLGGLIEARAGALSFTARYLDGTLNETTTDGGISVVQGSLMVGIRTARWLRVEGGVRALTLADTDRERWVTWTGGLRADIPILAPGITGHFSLAGAMKTEVNLPEGRPTGRSGEVGITVVFPGGRVGGDISMALDRFEVDRAEGRSTGTLAVMLWLRTP